MAESKSAENAIKTTITASSSDDSLQWSDEDDPLWSEISLEPQEDVREMRGAGDAAACSSSGDSPLAKRAKMENEHRLRFRHRYMWVSDMMKQLWCEQQLHYSFIPPATVVEIVDKPDVVKAKEQGTAMHLARELEVQDAVPVKITSDVDIFALKLINLLSAVRAFLTGELVRREIPIFGAPFDSDVFMIGLIDEIRVDPETFDWEIVELKTRRNNSVPPKSQKMTHELQIMLYKTLFDDLVSGKTSKELIERHLKLDFDKVLGEGIILHLKLASFDCKTLSGLWDTLTETIKAVPRISQLFIEYCWQEDRSTVALEMCQYNEDWMRQKIEKCLEYWTRQREAIGVDIEDAWKYRTCEYADACEWRMKKAEEHQKKNTINS